MDPKTALKDVVHVLEDIEKDAAHAADHSDELAEAVAHLQEAHIEVPKTLSDLNATLRRAHDADQAVEEAVEAQFDNMPV